MKKSKGTSIFMGRPLEFSKLMPLKDVIEQMQKSGADDRALLEVRDYYAKVLGYDPVWRYPISDNEYLGSALIPVQEGFLYLPYDYVDAQDYECYCLDECTLLDYDTARSLQQTMKDYADGLDSALNDISFILADRQIPGAD